MTAPGERGVGNTPDETGGRFGPSGGGWQLHLEPRKMHGKIGGRKTPRPPWEGGVQDVLVVSGCEHVLENASIVGKSGRDAEDERSGKVVQAISSPLGEKGVAEFVNIVNKKIPETSACGPVHVASGAGAEKNQGDEYNSSPKILPLQGGADEMGFGKKNPEEECISTPKVLPVLGGGGC